MNKLRRLSVVLAALLFVGLFTGCHPYWWHDSTNVWYIELESYEYNYLGIDFPNSRGYTYPNGESSIHFNRRIAKSLNVNHHDRVELRYSDWDSDCLYDLRRISRCNYWCGDDIYSYLLDNGLSCSQANELTDWLLNSVNHGMIMINVYGKVRILMK